MRLNRISSTWLALLFSAILVFSMVAVTSGYFHESPTRRGPKIDKVRFKVIKSPDATLIAMQTCVVDIAPDLIRTGDIEKLDRDGFTVTSAPGFHMGHIGLNIRPDQTYKTAAGTHPLIGPVMSDVNFRLALLLCYNQEEIVASIYKYIVTPVRSLVPPALGGWVNPEVPSHPYNPGDPEGTTVWDPETNDNEDACSVLRYGGYTYSGGVWTTPYDLDGDTVNDPLPGISLWTPTYEVAPTSAEHGARFVADCNAVGIPIIHNPREFSPYLEDVFGAGDFDMYMVFWSLSRFADHLYDMCDSSQDCAIYPWRYNAPGINDPEMDAAVETVKFSLNHTEKLAAAYKAQEMLYNATYEHVAFAYLQLYSRIYFNAFKPGMKGIVNSPGYGSDNIWTFMNMHWIEGHPNERIENFGTEAEPDYKSVIIYCLGEEPERMNPCYAHTVYAWDIIGTVTGDSLISINPYTLEDIPGLADDWSIDDFTGYTTGSDPGIYIDDGMVLTFWLNDTVMWQDGLPYTAEDARFNWLFMRDNEIPRYTTAWEHIASVDVVTPGQGGVVKVYLDITSQFLIYDVAGIAAVLPPPVWSRFDFKTGTIEDQQIILGYDPSTNTTKPTGAGPWFGDGVQGHPTTQLYGTGPFVFEFYDETGMYGEVHQFVDYWKYTWEIQAAKAKMFHQIGDVDSDGEIGIFDLSRQGVAFGAIQGLDPEYDPDADLNSDGIIDMRDIALTCYFYGDLREYPEP